MAWIKAFNFRGTAAYVTDGTDETCVPSVNGDGVDRYPVTRNGVTFGWTNTVLSDTPQGRDRNNTLDPRLAGIHFWGNTLDAYPGTFRVDLPASGVYLIGLAAGDADGAFADGFVEVRDTATPLVTIDHTSNFTSGGNFRDATDTEYTPAAWPGSQTLVSKTFATTVLILALGKYGGAVSSDGNVAHLYVEQVSAGGLTHYVRMTA